MQKSPLQIARQSYQPKMPVALQGAVRLVEGEKTHSVADQEEIQKLFPNTYGLPVITMEPVAESKVESQKSKEGEWTLIGQCKTVWAILDIQKREIVNIFDDPMFENCLDGEVIDMPRVRMTTIPEPTGSMPHKIVYSDIDYNGHCNSCRYLQAMTDAYLPDYYGKKIRLDINYSKEAMLGEEMQIYYLVTDDGVQYQMKNKAGETSCSAKLSIGDW